MQIFIYRAKKGSLELINGEIEADSQDQAVRKLEEMGLTPINVIEKGTGDFNKAKQLRKTGYHRPQSAIRVRAQDIDTFTRQLAILIKTSVPMLRSLYLISQQTENKVLKSVVSDLEKEIKDGKTLSEAMRKYPGIFNNLYINIIRSGEKGGVLTEVLYKLAEHREKEQEIKRKIQEAMAYPLLMITVGTGTIFVMLTFFLPKLTGLFENMKQGLPLPTKILIGASAFMSENWYWFLFFFILAILIFGRAKPGSKKKAVFDMAKLHIPFIKKFIMNAEIAKFVRTLGLLLKHGLPVYESLEFAVDALDNDVLRQRLAQVEKEIINKGSTLSASLKRANVFPNFAVNMIAIGEEGGKIDEVLIEIANVYEREVDQAIKIMTSLLEPLLILGVGAVVGFIVFAMLLPIFNIGGMAK